LEYLIYSPGKALAAPASDKSQSVDVPAYTNAFRVDFTAGRNWKVMDLKAALGFPVSHAKEGESLSGMCTNGTMMIANCRGIIVRAIEA
jgi:hypothetical protein